MATETKGCPAGWSRTNVKNDELIKTPPASQAYRDGWERAFGKKPSDEQEEKRPGFVKTIKRLFR